MINCFLSNFPILGAKNFFLEKLALSCKTSHGILAPCQNLEKLMTQFRENVQTDGRTEGRIEGRTEGWKDGREDGQTLFNRTLRAISGDPKTRMRNIVC